MKILVVHPVMNYLGGGERLCCETIRSLVAGGHEVTLLSQVFDPGEVENFFGYDTLFHHVSLALYPAVYNSGELGTSSHLLHHSRAQHSALKDLSGHDTGFDLLFSTQDPGYIPDLSLPVLQWGYFPRIFPGFSSVSSPSMLPRFLRNLPLRLYYEKKIPRIGLALAISRYSQQNLDRVWRRPSVIVYPACNMIDAGEKHGQVVTASRAVPIKRLELFWKLASLRPQYEFVMLLTVDAESSAYAKKLSALAPSNGKTVINPSKELYHRLMGQARAYVHLMENEHFGITVVEAMSAMCIPIVHDSGGPREILGSELGFKWKKFEEIPYLLDKAMTTPPSLRLRERAYDFSVEGFDRRLSSLLSGLHVRTHL